MAYEYVNIRTDTIDNVKVPTKETLDARTIIESTLEPFAGADDQVWSYRIGLWQFPKTGFYKINLPKSGAKGKLLQAYARQTQEDGTLPENDWDTKNLKYMSFASGDGEIDAIYVYADYVDNSTTTSYKVQFVNIFSFPGYVNVNLYDKATQKWSYTSALKTKLQALEITKGDQTINYNGTTKQTVSIPTKTSELTNDSNFTTQTDLDTVVSYSAQENITDEQRAQARTNIGAVSSSDLVQSDWNQNDTTAKDYIKNRICYTKDATETIVLNSTLPFTDISSSSGLTVFSYQDTSSNIKFNEGTTYTVNFDTTSYTCIAFTDDRLSNAVILGNLGIAGMSSATNEPFAIITDSKGSQGLQILTNLTGTSHSVKITEIHTEIIKLDKKYIPDDIFTSIENIDNKVEDFINNAQFLAKTDSVGTGSFSFNRETGSTVGENSATFGLNNIASGKYAFAEGSINKATNFASHAEGNNTTASGNASHAEGLSTKATGATSHSEGLDTVASGDYSHAEGEGTTAEGKWSHTEGKSTNTKGWASHAEGSETVAQGIYSHAEGRFTVALGENQHVEGILNIEDTTSLHIVGNGTYTESSGQKTKSNAHTLDKLGNAWFAGNVYVGSTSGTNKDDGSKKLATEEYVNNKTTTITVEDTLSDTSTNPVQNKVINTALKDKLQYKGNWQSNTTYNKNDVVYDETNLMYVYTETDATSDPPDINPNCQPLVNIATNVKKGTLGVPNASTIYSQFNYLIDASTTDSGKYLTVNSEGNPEWGTITAPEESVVIAKLTGAGTTASPYACDKTYNELYTAILAGKYVLMYDSTTKRMLSPYFIIIQARLLQFQHVLCEQTGSTTTTSKLTVITVNYNGGSNTLTRTIYSSNIVSSVNGKTGNVITLSASDVGAASSEDLNTLKNSIPEISVVTLDD